MKITYLIILFLSIGHFSKAGDTLTSVFDKKFLVGVSFTNGWTGIKGENLARNYVRRPSLGGGIHAEYFFMNLIGLGTGIQFQQRGATIVNQDVIKELGNPDSTYRERLRFNNWEVPLYLVVHSPSFKNKVRFWVSAGVVYSMNLKVQKVFYSIEDGFHDVQDQTSDYYRHDLFYAFSVGLDINAGSTGVFQMQFFQQMGTQNVYRNTGNLGSFNANNDALGIRLSFMY